MNYFSVCIGSLNPQGLLQALPEGLASFVEAAALVGGLWGFFLLVRSIVGAIFCQKPHETPAAPTEPQTVSKDESIAGEPTSPSQIAGLPTPLFAVIAATCHLVLNRPHRILAVESMGGADQWSGLDLRSWSREGRRDIFTSHQLR